MSDTLTQTRPVTTPEKAARPCRFEAAVQVGASIVVAAVLATGMMAWFTHPVKRTVRRPVTTPVIEFAAAPGALRPANATHGKLVFSQTCFACHGPTGAGIPGLGAPLRSSKFVAARNDDQLATFIKSGRQPFDPDTVLHLTMPPKGGNPALSDTDIRDVIAFVRTLQQEESAASGKPIANAAP